MQARLSLLLPAWLALVVASLSPALSSAVTVPPGAPQVAAKAYILVDFYSGQVLLEQQADLRLEPASLTKLMTAYVVFQELHSKRIQLSDKVRVSEKAWRMGGSRMYLELDSQVTIEELLRGMIIQSGNDASLALAEFVAGSEEAFAGVMNQYAEKLGMSASHFINSTGMPGAEHYTTARDMTKVTAAIIREFPDYYKYYSEREYTYNNITQQNRNILLGRDPSVDGVKTGYTENAGYCLITSGHQDNMRLITVVMGTDSAKSRAAETQKLLTYGFRFYETHELYKAGVALDTPKVWKGGLSQVQLGLSQSLYVTIPRGQYEKLSATRQLSESIVAPVAKDTPLGSVKVSLEGTLLVERPLVALHEVPEGNFFQRLLDYLLMQL